MSNFQKIFFERITSVNNLSICFLFFGVLLHFNILSLSFSKINISIVLDFRQVGSFLSIPYFQFHERDYLIVLYFRFRFPRKEKLSVIASYLISVGLFFSQVTSSAFSLIASSMSFSTTPASMSDSEEKER